MKAIFMKLSMSTLVVLMLLFSSCSALVDGTFRQNFIGCWDSISYVTISTDQEVSLPIFGFDMLEHEGDSFEASVDGTFNMFYQQDPEFITASGTFETDFGDVTFTFDDGSIIERSILLAAETELTLSDTLNGQAIKINFVETCP